MPRVLQYWQISPVENRMAELALAQARKGLICQEDLNVLLALQEGRLKIEMPLSPFYVSREDGSLEEVHFRPDTVLFQFGVYCRQRYGPTKGMVIFAYLMRGPEEGQKVERGLLGNQGM